MAWNSREVLFSASHSVATRWPRRPADGAIALAVAAVLGLVALAKACEYTADMPPRIVSLREEMLSKERYSALAKDWQRYVEAHPKAALGFLYLWRARRYAQEAGQDQGLELVKRAFALDPQCAEVLCDLSYLEFGEAERAAHPDYETARAHAQRATELRPDWYEPHISLLNFALRTGDAAEQSAQLGALVRTGAFPAQLLDFANNLLVSAAPDAIVLTNGDNDTFPTLALQSVYGQRPDVRIVNLSLLNLRAYPANVLVGSSARPGPFTQAEIEALQKQAAKTKQPPMQLLVQSLVKQVTTGTWKQPVYLACTVPFTTVQQLCTQPLTMEGLLYRVEAGPRAGTESTPDVTMDKARTDSLLTSVFRLQSATQFGYAWDEDSAVAMLMWNYVGLWQRTASAYAAAGDLGGARRMLRSAVAMLRAHPELRGTERDHLGRMMEYWKEIDPQNPEVDALRRELGK